MTTWIYYDSKTGNVERFVSRLKLHRNWMVQKIDDTFEPLHFGHLITYTTAFGEVPPSTMRFLEKNSSMIKSISCSGNTNWGANYTLAATKIAEQFGIPVLLRFELSGTMADIQQFIDKIEG